MKIFFGWMAAFTAAIALGVVLGLSTRACAQEIVNPPVTDHWEVGLLCPGLRFDLTGKAPAAVAAGSGVSFNYLFGKYIYTSPNKVAHPWFGVSLFAQGGANINSAVSGVGAVGAGLIVLDYVCLGWVLDLIAAGPGQVPSGLFTGNLSLANTGPVVLTSIPLP